jgi:hypothetical protein
MRYIDDMDLEELLLSIVEVLDDDHVWVREIVAWWNRYITFRTWFVICTHFRLKLTLFTSAT